MCWRWPWDDDTPGIHFSVSLPETCETKASEGDGGGGGGDGDGDGGEEREGGRGKRRIRDWVRLYSIIVRCYSYSTATGVKRKTTIYLQYTEHVVLQITGRAVPDVRRLWAWHCLSLQSGLTTASCRASSDWCQYFCLGWCLHAARTRPVHVWTHHPCRASVAVLCSTVTVPYCFAVNMACRRHDPRCSAAAKYRHAVTLSTLLTLFQRCLVR